jgi:hypothetical protein
MDTVPVRYLVSQATGGDNSVRRASVQRCTVAAARTAGWPAGIQNSRSQGTAPENPHSKILLHHCSLPDRIPYITSNYTKGFIPSSGRGFGSESVLHEFLCWVYLLFRILNPPREVGNIPVLKFNPFPPTM